jgi:two-component system LytT family response regulator
MIKALLIDDEPLARSIVREYLKHYTEINIVTECNDGFEGVKAIAEHRPDIIFLDIQMPKINGFEMLELVENPPDVIFTTAYDEYAIKAFETYAVDYLLKPFGRERFDKAMQKWLSRQNMPAVSKTENLLDTASLSPGQNQRIVVKIGGKIKIIPVHEIIYLEAADDFVKIHTQEGSFLKNKTMNHFENVLEAGQFARIHRSYIVNIQQITRIDPYEKDNHIAVLRSGGTVPMSKAGYTKLKSVLGL